MADGLKKYGLEYSLAHKDTDNRDEGNRELIKRFREGDKSALSELCSLNLGFVRTVALTGYRAYGSDLPLEDLIQEGMIGLIKAAGRFDLERSEKFLTYAWWYVISAILRANVCQGFTIRISDCIMHEIMKLVQADKLYSHLNRQERIEALSAHLDMTGDKIMELWRVTELLYLARADKPIDADDEEIRVRDYFRYAPENPLDDIERAAELQDLRNMVTLMMERLTERERKVISLRFGLEGNNPRSLEDIGQDIGITRERVRQIVAKSLRKMRGFAIKNSLQEYL